MKKVFERLPAAASLAIAAALALGGTAAQAQDKTITLCWAAWDPANALVELSKDFTAKSNIKMSSSSCRGPILPTACSTSSTPRASYAT